ncbi:LEA type 2 family protein [Halobium salinum]|uniref:LEA type 2 family protein n=1 Tax=Halobium salinum TaxID=1364940 RepID=A0ABD5PGM9_9EURY|nr:LEA type 2 family protein [Halobium salinum]
MDRIRALLSGTRRLVTVAAVLVLVAAGVAVATGVFGAPSVAGVDNRFGPVDDETTAVETDLHVSNPNPLGVSFGDATVDYAVSMNGVGMAEGTKSGVALDRGASTLAFRTDMHNERIPDWWVSHVRNDERTTLTVDASVSSPLLGGAGVDAPAVEREVETDLVGGFASNETRPVNASRPLVSDPVLYVNETDAAWGEVNDSATPIDTNFTLYNPKPVPVALTEVGYTVTMNDVTVGQGASDRTYVVPSGEARTLETTTRIDNSELDEWWVSHLQRNQTTDLRIEFYATLRVGGDSIRVPLDSLTYEKTFETDVFGTKADGGEVANASGGSTTATTTATDGESGSEGTTGTTAGGSTTTATTTTDAGGLFGGGDGNGSAGDGGGPGTTTTDDGLLGLRS